MERRTAEYFHSKKKRLGGGTQPKEDEMKICLLLKLRYQNAAEIQIRSVMYFTVGRAVFFVAGNLRA